MTGQVTRHLEDGDGSLFHIATDTHADARFEVGVKFVKLYQIEGNGAVGKEHLACLRIDAGGIGLKAADTHDRLRYLHGQHRRHIALTTCHDALCIQFGQCQTPRVMNGGQQVETADGEAL